MKKWIERQNAYSIIKLITIIMYLYTMVSSLIFSFGGCTKWGMLLSGSAIYYFGVFVISFTPPGRVYLSGYMRFVVGLLFIVRIYHEACHKYLSDFPVPHEYRVAVAIIVISTAAFYFGFISGKTNTNGTKKTTRKDRA